MKQPSGVDLLSRLIDLYADQHGVTVTYSIEDANQAKKHNEGGKACG